jgi:hypothetical protein
MKMNRKLMIVIPVIAAVLAIGIGTGVAYARGAEHSPAYQPVSNYSAAPPANTSDNTTWQGSSW